MSGKSFGQDEFLVLERPYLGQTPPGLVPKVFAPGIVSTKYYEFNGVFTPDMKEFYLIRNGGIYKKPSFETSV